MRNKSLPLLLALLGILTGAVLGEFFPEKIAGGFGDVFMGAMSEPFSPYRNGLALRWGLVGGLAGAVLGIIVVFYGGKSEDTKKG